MGGLYTPGSPDWIVRLNVYTLQLTCHVGGLNTLDSPDWIVRLNV